MMGVGGVACIVNSKNMRLTALDYDVAMAGLARQRLAAVRRHDLDQGRVDAGATCVDSARRPLRHLRVQPRLLRRRHHYRQR